MNKEMISPDKMYFTIGEVADLLGESVSLVRFWADSFPYHIKPERNKKGNRLFSQEDLANFKLIYHLVKEQGMTLTGAQKRLKENKEGVAQRVEVVERLKSIKETLSRVYEMI